MESSIINRGRGPEIAGTRITIYDVMDYLNEGWHHSAIAATLRISSSEVLAAVEYIRDHQEEVQVNDQKILERIARSKQPDIQERLDNHQAKYQQHWANRR